MDFKRFYEWYHRDRKLPKRIIGKKNFTYRIILGVLDRYCKAKDVLDVGSGVGTVDFYLAKKGKRVTGVEISERAFKVASESLKLFNLSKNVTFKRQSFYDLSSKRTFSFVICSEVLEHLPDDKKALKSIYKLVSNNGLFMLTVPSKNAPLKFFGAIKPFDKRSGHLRRYTEESAKQLLSEIGFKPIYSEKCEGIIRNALFVYRWDFVIKVANKFSWVSDIITFFDDILLSLFGESQIIIVSKV
jgi:SAM-dependent methyltransferase